MLTLASCFAVDVLGDQVGHVRQPVVSPMRHVIRKNDEPFPTSELSRVLEWWGEPDERSTRPDGSETLTYYDGVRWNGLVLFVIILPIPLVIPVGHDYLELDVVNGMVVAARTTCDVSLMEAYLGVPLHGMWCGINHQPPLAVGDQFQRY
jgi:hypothetical protein